MDFTFGRGKDNWRQRDRRIREERIGAEMAPILLQCWEKVKAKFLKGVLKELVTDVGSNGTVEEGVGLKIVPGAGRDPSVLWFVGLGSHEPGGVGYSESPDCPGVGEQGVVDGFRHEAVPEGLLKKGGLRKLDASWYFERHEVFRWKIGVGEELVWRSEGMVEL